MKNQAWRIDLPNVGKAITDVESVANWYREHGCEVVELVDRESNHEKDKRIAELEAITNVQLETITDLENRLEALQSSQSQVSEAAEKYLESMKSKSNFCHGGVHMWTAWALIDAFKAGALQPSTPKEQAE